MTYDEIINKNKDMLPSDYKWWATHAFHFTALDNAISILKSGVLYGRIKANQNALMHNENASRAVISTTDFEVLSYVRFYFRPLTPTQYYNEGFKHSQLRLDSQGSNISIPIFFVFKLNFLLSDNKNRDPPCLLHNGTVSAPVSAHRVFYNRSCLLHLRKIS